MSNDNAPVVCCMYAQQLIDSYRDYYRCFSNLSCQNPRTRELICDFIRDAQEVMESTYSGFTLSRIMIRGSKMPFITYLVFENIFEDKVAYHRYKLKNPQSIEMIERGTRYVAEFLTPTSRMGGSAFEGYPVYFC